MMLKYLIGKQRAEFVSLCVFFDLWGKWFRNVNQTKILNKFKQKIVIYTPRVCLNFDMVSRVRINNNVSKELKLTY